MMAQGGSTCRPKLLAPPGACDTHVHIFEPALLAALGGATKPPAASLAAYRLERDRLGLTRSVIVQPTAFRFDNTGTLQALAALGDTARAVVIVERDTTVGEMRRMAELGVRGVRFHLLRSGLLEWEDLETMAPKIAEVGWHCQVQFDGRQFPDRAPMLARLPGTLVIDHIGKFLEPVRVDDPAFTAMLGLLENGRTYVKLCAPYEVSKTGAPDYADVAPLAKSLAKAAPDRMLWASNWPHQSTPVDRRSDDAALLDLLLDWVPDETERRKVLVDNPARLYGFAPAMPA